MRIDAGGTGRSQVIYNSQVFFCQFAAKLGLIFNKKTFLITACTGSAAALLKGFTIHSCAHLNRKRLNDEFREYWSEVRILIIDECSFLSSNDLKKLDKNLRLLRKRDVSFGGVNIIFAGDFYQLLPFNNKSVLYSLVVSESSSLPYLAYIAVGTFKISELLINCNPDPSFT